MSNPPSFEPADWAITGISFHAPPPKVTVEQAASRGGVQVAQLRERVGFEGVHASEDGAVSPWHVFTEAGRKVLKDAHITPHDLDFVLHVGRNRLDYLCMAHAMSLMKEIGTTKAMGLDMGDWTGGTLLTGLRVMRSRMLSDPQIHTAMVSTHHRFGDMVDRTLAKDQWIWPIGDGAACVVMQRGGKGPVPLAHAFHSEGRGSKQLTLRQDYVDEGPEPDSWFTHEWAQWKYFTLRKPDAWYEDYKARAQRWLPAVVDQAVERAGLRMEQVARVQAGFLFPEVAAAAARDLGVGDRFRRHNGDGWLAGCEGAVALDAMRRDPALKGKHVVLCHAGLPADFGAMVFRL